jgi:hypothetical protein
MKDFELKADGPGFWAITSGAAAIGWIIQGGDGYRACTHAGTLTRHSDWQSALAELVQ